MDNYGLGRLYIKDNRDRNYHMRSLLRETPGVTYRYWWDNGAWLNQGNTPSCVGHVCAHWLADGPITKNYMDPFKVYYDAQKVDKWPGENYQGTSVRAGMKVLQKNGFVSNYYWAWDLETMLTALLTKGPVVVGTNWYNSMFYPNKDGLITVEGQPSGGHAWLVTGVNMKKQLLRGKNSWGRHWGVKGRFWITFKDMQRLIGEYGEVAIATEVKKDATDN